MADLTVLIRLHKHELDEKRRALGELYAAMAALERQRQELELTFAHEKAAMDASGEVHFTFASYVDRVKKQRESLLRGEADMERQIELAKDSLMETFAELKKYEMTQEERDRLEEEEQRYKETRVFDEIGLEGFRRKGDEG